MKRRPGRRPLDPFVRIARWIATNKIEEDPAGCWIWLGTRSQGGYGQIAMSPKAVGVADGPRVHASVHRWMYEFHMAPIPEGLDLDHLCRVRACCNPWHLEPVTRSENLRRAVGMGAYQSAKTHCPSGHEYTPENTTVKAGSRNCRTCQHIYEKKRWARTKADRYVEAS